MLQILNNKSGTSHHRLHMKPEGVGKKNKAEQSMFLILSMHVKAIKTQMESYLSDSQVTQI